MDTSCLAYEYGCLPPSHDLEKMIDVLYKRNQLWNELVTIEREHHAKSQELITPDNPELIELDTKIELLRQEIKTRRKSARKSIDVSELAEQVKQLKTERKQLYAIVKEQKKVLIAERKEQLAILEKNRRGKVKKAYAASGLYWGNYNDVINNSYNVARIRAMKEGKELKYHRFDGSGKLSVQIQGGLAVEDVFKSKNNLLQIQLVDEAAWTCPIRAERRRLSRSKFRIRIGSNEDRSPIWMDFLFVMHRPLPVEGMIKTASVVRKKLGNTYRYTLIITVVFPQHVQKVSEKAGSIGIDLGWRMTNKGLRVAYWADEHGSHDQLILPTAILDRFQTLKDLKSIRDNHFNDACQMLKTWMQNKSLPEWLRENTKYITQWKSPVKFVLLLKEWEENHFSGDQEITAYLHEYLKRENHLWLWEFNLRDKIQKRRRELYHIFAAKIVKKYSCIIIEKFDLRKVAEKPTAEEGTQGTLPMSFNRTIAAVSILRNIIEATAGREGVAIVPVEAKNSTITCHVCGSIEKFEAEKSIFHTCSVCGTLWDQDYNAALNLLKR